MSYDKNSGNNRLIREDLKNKRAIAAAREEGGKERKKIIWKANWFKRNKMKAGRERRIENSRT